MMEFGKTLRNAREGKGLTVAQMTEMTHLAPTTINELETEDFSRIAAPIYGRGFVKLYCEAVGLDPKPLVAEFMELISGSRDVGIKERPVEPEPEESPVVPEAMPEDPAAPTLAPQSPDEIPPICIPTLGKQVDLFGDELPPDSRSRTEIKSRRMSLTPPSLPPESATPQPIPEIEHTPDDDHSFSRYAEPLRQLKPIIPTPLWRIGVLAGGLLLLLVLLILGIRAVYRATSAAPVTANGPQVSEPAQPKPAEVAKPVPNDSPKPSAVSALLPATSRKPQKIPALYID